MKFLDYFSLEIIAIRIANNKLFQNNNSSFLPQSLRRIFPRGKSSAPSSLCQNNFQKRTSRWILRIVLACLFSLILNSN